MKLNKILFFVVASQINTNASELKYKENQQLQQNLLEEQKKFEQLQNCAKQGEYEAMSKLAKCYKTKAELKYLNKEYSELNRMFFNYIYWHQKLAHSKLSNNCVLVEESCIILAKIYKYGKKFGNEFLIDINIDLSMYYAEKGFDSLLNKYNSGFENWPVFNLLGFCYENGFGTEKNLNLAKIYYEKFSVYNLDTPTQLIRINDEIKKQMICYNDEIKKQNQYILHSYFSDITPLLEPAINSNVLENHSIQQDTIPQKRTKVPFVRKIASQESINTTEPVKARRGQKRSAGETLEKNEYPKKSLPIAQSKENYINETVYSSPLFLFFMGASVDSTGNVLPNPIPSITEEAYKNR